MRFIVATNVVASGPPERRPTGTPYAPAKIRADQDHYLRLVELELTKAMTAECYSGVRNRVQMN